MAMFYKPPAVEVNPPVRGDGLPVSPPPNEVPPVNPQPWIEAPLPPESEKRPPPAMPPVVVIEPVEKPPVILPPLPDMTPPSIVPWVYEDPIPDALPMPPVGHKPPVRPPPTIVVSAAVVGLGTFMVYVGRKLVLTMAASLGTSLGKSAGTMLVGAVNKQLFRGTTIRFHTGQSYGLGDHTASDDRTDTPGKSVSYEQAWRMVPQEFSYWEA